jgi:hypothetical protein
MSGANLFAQLAPASDQTDLQLIVFDILNSPSFTIGNRENESGSKREKESKRKKKKENKKGEKGGKKERERERE